MIQRSIWNQELVLLEKIGRKKNEQEGYRNFNLEVESFQILKIEDKEENFSFMETMGKENHNSAGL